MNLWEPQGKRGWIEVIAGPMFSGKSEELQRRLRLAEFADKRVVLFKPSKDTRDGEGESVSHAGRKMPCLHLSHPERAIPHYESKGYHVVGFEEAQFYDEGLVTACQRLAASGVRVIAAGLPIDYAGRLFGEMSQLMAIAEVVDKRHAVCTLCGGPASFSERVLGRSAGQIHVGGADAYEARCRLHFTGFSR